MYVKDLIKILETYEPNDSVVIDLDVEEPHPQDLYGIEVDDVVLDKQTQTKEIRLIPKN